MTVAPAIVKGDRPAGPGFDAAAGAGAKPCGAEGAPAAPIVNPAALAVVGPVGLGPDASVAGIADHEAVVRAPAAASFPGTPLGTVQASNTLNTSIGLPELVPVSVSVASCNGPTPGPAYDVPGP